MSENLTCPKCGTGMRCYERNRVVVDHCPGCGGIFLDRGELERLTEAESTFYSKTEPSSHQAPPPHRERRDQGHPGQARGKKKKNPTSFLADFLEF